MRLIAAWLAVAVLAAGEPALTVDRGVLHAASVEILGFRLHDVSVEPRMEGRVVRFERLAAQAYGGSVGGWIEIDLDPGRAEYRGDVTITGVDLALLLRAHGLGGESVGGTVDGRFAFRMPADRPQAITGQGVLTVRDGTLVQLSVLANVLVGDPNQARGRDRASATVAVAAGRIQVQQARITSPVGLIALRGTVGIDGSLDLAASSRPRGGVFRPIPLVGDVAVWATAKLARYAIRGTLAAPELRLNPFGDDLGL
ncbi:MAG: AsmA family [Planctomycetota bacterium]|jgi:hypothetical protein